MGTSELSRQDWRKEYEIGKQAAQSDWERGRLSTPTHEDLEQAHKDGCAWCLGYLNHARRLRRDPWGDPSGLSDDQWAVRHGIVGR